MPSNTKSWGQTLAPRYSSYFDHYNSYQLVTARASSSQLVTAHTLRLVTARTLIMSFLSSSLQIMRPSSLPTLRRLLSSLWEMPLVPAVTTASANHSTGEGNIRTHQQNMNLSQQASGDLPVGNLTPIKCQAMYYRPIKTKLNIIILWAWVSNPVNYASIQLWKYIHHYCFYPFCNLESNIHRRWEQKPTI